MNKRTFLKMSALMSAGTLLKTNLSGSNLVGIESYSNDFRQAVNIEEAKRSLPVYDTVDVLVCGGGLGGSAAALAAARAGAKTLLVERNTYLGGVATAGMCCSVFNCYFTGGEKRKLETHGIALEIADAFAETSGAGPKWRQHKGHIIFDLEKAKLVLQQKTEQAGVKLLLGTFIVSAIMDNERLRGVVIENKSGRQTILAKTVVDSTGDADIAAFAGAPVNVFEKGKNSLVFRFGNVDIDRFIQYFKNNPSEYPEYMDVDWNFDEAMAQYRECGTFLFPHGGGIQMKAFKNAKISGDLPETVGIQDTTDAAQMHAIRNNGIVHVITGYTEVSGTDAGGISKSVIDGRKMVYEVAKVYRKYLPGFENSFVVGVADNLGVRWTRRISGSSQLQRVKAGLRFNDAIGRAVAWDGIKKHPGEGAWSVQVCHDDSFDVPRSCLLPEKVEGLIMGAGRSVNAKNTGELRVMAHTMVVGQGAGVTAAMAALNKTTPRNVSIDLVQDILMQQGAL
jgi:ribulose 1,5-bisphosphate synthetase/thiazole synthase